jgi:hypothetical protein
MHFAIDFHGKKVLPTSVVCAPAAKNRVGAMNAFCLFRGFFSNLAKSSEKPPGESQ